jgi:hypothetical protein
MRKNADRRSNYVSFYRASRGNIGGRIFNGSRLSVEVTGMRIDEAPRTGPFQLLDWGTL